MPWRTRTACRPDLQAHLGQRLGALALNRYPGERVNDLRSALAAYADARGLRPDAGQRLGRADLAAGHGLRCTRCQYPGSVPGFVMYAMSAQLQGLKFIGVADAGL
jgi:histidinol-phosphate aminotransferase